MSSTNKPPVQDERVSLRKVISKIITYRRTIRIRINEDERLDRFLHIFSTFVFAINIVLIVYALLSLTSRMLISGVPLVDSLPMAFYILPLMIFLPLILLAYYRTRSAILAIAILVISAVVFGIISGLIRGFIVLLILNISAVVIVFVLGRFRSKYSIRKIGKRGIAWLVFLNSLGLMLPISIYIMGQVPIATVSSSEEPTIFLEMPLGAFEYSYVNITPTTAILDEFSLSSFGIDLRVLAGDNESINRLILWLDALESNSIQYRITISTNREALDSFDSNLLGSTSLFESLYELYWSTLERILTLMEEMSIPANHHQFVLDMRLSQLEWELLMSKTRNVDLLGFSSLIRESIDSISKDELSSIVENGNEIVSSQGISLSYSLEGFAVDDLLDNDATMMTFCGVTSETLASSASTLEIFCDRTRYSYSMSGDVGEYLVYAYSLSPAISSIRLGTIGLTNGLDLNPSPVYQELDELAMDIVIASGNGVAEIVLSSLPFLISTYGENGPTQLKSEIESIGIVEVTYTFRVYAFRAVIMAIDSFDSIML